MKRSAFWLTAAVVLLTAWPALCRAQTTPAETFHNPLLPVGPDPWVISDNGFYYYMNSMGSNLTIWKTRDITDLAHAERQVVWTPPVSGPYSKELWAPELHRLDGKWYIYFAADAGRNESHRIYVVENDSADPLQGEWVFKGKIADATDRWAIDATVFEDKGQRYILWSGWEGETDGEQRIYIAHLKDPLTIDSERVTVTFPKYPWEHVGDILNRAEMPHVDVNEGPEILQHGDDVFLIYSASGCWTDYYALGLVRAKSGTNLLDPASWSKAQYPVFSEYPLGSVYGPGHNGFFKSPDGKEDWIIYHANPARNQGCGDKRSPRIQPFTWNPDGTPNFGRPIPTSTAIQKPSK